MEYIINIVFIRVWRKRYQPQKQRCKEVKKRLKISKNIFDRNSKHFVESRK